MLKHKYTVEKVGSYYRHRQKYQKESLIEQCLNLKSYYFKNIIMIKYNLKN